MTKVTIKQLQSEIETLRELRIEDKRGYARTLSELESLRMDKKWLQQMHSSLIQSIPEMFRNRNALSR